MPDIGVWNVLCNPGCLPDCQNVFGVNVSSLETGKIQPLDVCRTEEVRVWEMGLHGTYANDVHTLPSRTFLQYGDISSTFFEEGVSLQWPESNNNE